MATAPQHPGRALAERMREVGISANKLARDTRIPTNRITMTIRGERNITADTALRLARWFGGDPAMWMDLQSRYDLHVVGKKLAREIARIPTRVKREGAA